ncbi:polysaccharide deacetylase family protein [Paraburkholderia silvatlantica]|uniref:Peptidoglycan/xylan/chitin deacetylase (PgdA/CDA1 family) n=1 Tax=Paraburkholderia silvatlantica TaxID=321895 RepID=A0A2V4THL5_9BURK|nr:polysaccharide deacetylase family protein [Paraburkholderia silvatlantica]PYE25025.1 peptidoglycan/xylan/chitin deacetylase (PgdA/CDA1 family) [Paraburkholderia silvatlantica]TDR05219.1 peptidoglycan/xylan/chitin deacetylase (PgdA/CDA1 family) [Paraburkholderia silvatlantica]
MNPASLPATRVMPAFATARRWKPSQFICGAAALHAGAAAAVAAQPHAWPWAAGSVVASHLALTAAGLWPRSALLGPNWTRLPEHAGQRIALTIDDGPDPEVTPRVLELLGRFDAHATFFCIGELAQRYPHLVEAIVARGHAVENHSQRHRHTFSVSGPLVMKREIEAAQRTLTGIAGTPPRFFRAPAGLRNPFLEPVLCALGLHLASWTRRGFDTCAKNAAPVTHRLLDGLAARDILLVHDGHAARDARGKPLVLDVLPPLLRAAAERQLQWTTLRACLDGEAGQP